MRTKPTMNKRMLRSVLAGAVVALTLALGAAGPLGDVGWSADSSAAASSPGDVGWDIRASSPDVGWIVVANANGAQDVGW
ncbi:MAG: hypothetical protein HOV73_15350 [Streptomyces sp.]|nr:hypothetical protein [Streptomyces sp.]NUR41451.1 hypothetical protein [Streptomyces sp.]NUR68297.1 hypothetical protein [Streptomyces sp.]NUS28379.1 hypothetical protein [Streptomyces sp.]